MQTPPANWISYLSKLTHKKEYQINISESDGTSPNVYGLESIKEASIESALLATDLWIGNCIARKLTMTVLSTVFVPRMAKIVISCRLRYGENATSYMPVGTFWVDERDTGSLWTTVVCYDAMLKSDQMFIDQDLEAGEWPIGMGEAVAEVCTRIGVALDARTTILTGTDYVVSYTNDLTMREVLGYVALAHGGNWTITPDGKLRLVPLVSAGVAPIHTLGQSIKAFSKLGNAMTISKVTLYDDAENSFTAGDTSGYALEVDCPYATENIASDLCNASTGSLYGVVYEPFAATSGKLDPLTELGDDVSVNDISSVIYTMDISISTAYQVDISAPADQEVDHEYPYLGSITRANNRNVKQNAAYYGVTISRAQGLKIAKTDGSAEAIFNSDVLTMRALDGGVMTNKIYFDPVSGKYIFDGELSADVITALSAVITPNLYAEKATIAELTVDQLDTSVKVKRYLDSDASDVNYLKIKEQTAQWITAQTDGLTTEQAEDRSGQPLYWTDETHTASTTDETDYPVTIYVYTEYVKGEISFYDDGTNYVPRIVLGTGTGVDDNDKLIIIKETSKAAVEYTTAGGNRMAIEMTADGVQVKGNTGEYGLRNIAIRDEAPADPGTNDLWIDTDA